MKNVFFMAVMLFSFFAVNAQNDSDSNNEKKMN